MNQKRNGKPAHNESRTDVLTMLSTENTTYVAYYRVSTNKQGESGLGLEGQRTAVERFADPATIAAEFTEIESGRKAERSALIEAIDLCQRRSCVLLVAKLDRLSRSVAFISQILDSSIEFRCCDMPDANRMVLQLMAIMAENEARNTSERTKTALAAARDRGTVLGKPDNFTDDGRRKGAATMRERAATAYSVLLPMIQQLKETGDSLAEIARKLNATGQRNIRGNPFNAMMISRILARAG